MGWSTRQVWGFTALILGVIVLSIVGMVTMVLYLMMGHVPEGDTLEIGELINYSNDEMILHLQPCPQPHPLPRPLSPPRKVCIHILGIHTTLSPLSPLSCYSHPLTLPTLLLFPPSYSPHSPHSPAIPTLLLSPLSPLSPLSCYSLSPLSCYILAVPALLSHSSPTHHYL